MKRIRLLIASIALFGVFAPATSSAKTLRSGDVVQVRTVSLVRVERGTWLYRLANPNGFFTRVRPNPLGVYLLGSGAYVARPAVQPAKPQPRDSW